MNIREVIEGLREVADRLPDGMDSQVRIHVCHGHDSGTLIKSIQVDSMAEQNRETFEIIDAYAIVQGHPHLDDRPGGSTLRPVTMDIEKVVQRWADEGPGDAPKEPDPSNLPSIDYTEDPETGVRYILLRSQGVMYVKMELDANGKIRYLPGSPDAVAAGCTCDPERNNHGAGMADLGEGGGVQFVYRNSCPLHQHVRWPN
ncbi:hypothetical protein [Pseudonocardia acaciae]|uniref:hypothetical protein n=1 Tax=Pseudonocardia acaciae TaxID=551276 RepID=UPI00048A7667|nr:hypothetical protein [Pseudonocardia acaciae]